MQKEFWLERWEKKETGFHQDEINPHLKRYWPELSLARDSEVFVPLCGKSRDMLWLRKQGHQVLGVELSDIAAQAFFDENDYTPDRSASGNFKRYEADEMRLLCGDFFDLGQNDLEKVTAVFDRAALVALPPDMRERYVRHLVNILPPVTQILLVAFDYPQSEMSGPPFAVSSKEVHELYRDYADVRLLAQIDALEQNPRFRERGLTRMQESIFRLTLR